MFQAVSSMELWQNSPKNGKLAQNFKWTALYYAMYLRHVLLHGLVKSLLKSLLYYIVPCVNVDSILFAADIQLSDCWPSAPSLAV